MKSPAFVSEIFRRYYSEQFSLHDSLSQIEKREFGFASLDGWMLRHKNFKTEGSLVSSMRESIPKDAYVSIAYYADPAADMDKKGWLGADLMFDIDSDRIPTDCERLHDSWVCKGCSFSGRGMTPAKCPACGSEKIEVQTWPCETCLNSARTEACKLIDFLKEDFGFSENDMRVFFSGNRGYHIQVDPITVRTLDSICRKEIVDYVTALGFDASFQGSEKRDNSRLLTEPNSKSEGWNRRIRDGVRNFLLNASAEDFAYIGVHKKVSSLLIENRNLQAGSIASLKGIGLKTWEKLVEHAIKDQSAKIDTVVTTDTHRLIRLPWSLHGKTGFIKTELSPSDISEYDPFSKAILINTQLVSMFVSDVPEFRLGDQTFGPYKNQKVELPTVAAILILCRDRGEVVEENV